MALSAGLGVARWPSRCCAHFLTRRLRALQEAAGELGRGNVLVPLPRAHERGRVRRLTLETALRKALECEEFEIYFQPPPVAGWPASGPDQAWPPGTLAVL